MKRSLIILPIAAMALLLTGCTAMLSMSMSGIGDLYRTDNRAEVAARLKAEAEAERIAAEARQAQWEARLAEANAAAAEAEYYAVVNNEPNYMSVVADDYESAYARRLYGFQSPTYKMPSSYYNMVNNSSVYYVTAYDPSYYNIMVSGDQVWVEPKYITSMFGSWGATNVTFGIYASPWNYGWSYHANPFYYSMWGYPRYSWYDWNWAMCYNPFYYDWCWGGYYDPFYPHYHHHHHHHYYPGHSPMPPRPDYRPTAGSGASRGPGNLNGNRGNTGTRYTSPTTNRNYGSNSRGEGRPTSGSTSLGFNSNSVKPSTGVNNSRYNAIESNTRINVGATGGSGGGSNFRTGSTTSSGTRINTTTTTTTQSRPGSSNNKVDASRTSNYRQGSSSSSSSSRVSSSSSSSRSSSSSSSSYRSGSSSSSSSNYRSGSSSSSSSYRSGSSSSSSSYRSGSSSSSGSFRSGGTSSSSGSSRSGGSSGGSRR